MSHEQFLSDIYSRLSTILSADPLLSDIKCQPLIKFNPSIPNSFITISIRCFDDSLIHVDVAEDARVFQLKRSIREIFSNKKISWKNIWKRYALATDDQQQQLINDNRKIEDYGVYNNSQLSFVRRRRLK